MNTLLITGTDLGVGKSLLANALGTYLQTHNPACRQTQVHLGEFARESEDGGAFGAESVLGRELDLALGWKQLSRASTDHDAVFVDTPGSLGCPLTSETTVADLAWDWRLPTVLVVPVRPGAVGQAIAHVALARQARVLLKGIVLSCPDAAAAELMMTYNPTEQIQSLAQMPVLGALPYLTEPSNPNQLAQAASQLALERLMPSLQWVASRSALV